MQLLLTNKANELDQSFMQGNGKDREVICQGQKL